MDKTEEIFVRILRNYIHGLSGDEIDFSQADMEKLKKLFFIHRVSGIGYSGMKDAKLDNKDKQEMEMRFYAELAAFHKRSTAFEKLRKLLNQHQVRHLCVKGSQMARFYPDPELRTMSDIDMLIEEKNKERVHEILMAEDAEYIQELSDNCVRVYKYCNTNFEIHTNLISEELWINGVNYQTYYADAFAYRKQEQNCTYVFQNEFNLVYLMTHVAKHFYHSGCGIRMLMDFPVFVKNCQHISWESVWEDFDRLHLTEFAAKIFLLCEEWFGGFGVEYPKKYRFRNQEQIEQFILAAGVYGFYGRNIEADKIKHFGNEKDGGSHYLKGVFRWAFPSNAQMRQYSSWYRKKPSILLPAAYVERFIRNAKERGGVWTWGKKVVRGSSDFKEKEKILSEMKLR